MRDYPVDRRRVYVAGISAGGGAAAILAAMYPDLYAAIGVHSGVAYGLAHDALSGLAAMKARDGFRPEVTPEVPPGEHPRIPTIVFQGDKDTTVDPRNADHFAAAMGVMKIDKRMEIGQVRGGRAYTQTTYRDALGHRLLEQWIIHGGGLA